MAARAPIPGQTSYQEALALVARNEKARATKPYIDLMMKAALSGHAKAQTNIGYAHATGEGLPKAPKEAVRWFTLAAAQGDAVAMDNLGYAYLNGDGVPRSNIDALAWYLKAAEKGYAPSQLSLSDLYAGNSEHSNLPLAIAWRRIAMLSEEHMNEAPTLLALEKKADKGQLDAAKSAYGVILRKMPRQESQGNMTK